MTLATGTRLGSFEIIGPLGAGGMGEVYAARDSRLGRSVAIKSIPRAYASDPERLARFEREAKLLASLNHPNIAGIHGLEEVEGAPYLVLEFVEGETLVQRLARGPIPVPETLEIAGQIASAIDAAHERGIVHRDLKPGNVMLTPARVVKVLDFGLAKGSESPSGSVTDLSASPTMALSATGVGVILGTAAYMSPEQARGRVVDRRTDVWAFGCLVFECLSGRPAFTGETVSDLIARILEREPEWDAIAAAPPRLRDLVRRCLTKDLDQRPRDIGDLRRELGAIAAELSQPIRASASASLPSLAVLYFENLANDQESEYFCAGITEDILTDLSKIKGLRVASRNAVARYRGAPVEIGKVAAELGVKAVLEGSVRRAGDRVRITAQLVNGADGFHLWAERYDRTLQDVFAVQEEIASSIAEALRVALSPAESEKLVHDRPSDARAYDLYLKGRARYGSYTADSFREALELFQQAIAIDPGYALAWAGVADCYGQMCQWGVAGDTDEMLRMGLEAAHRAIDLAPRLAEGYKALGLVLRQARDFEGARAALVQAIEANPRYTPALINLAVNTFCTADLAGAERLVRRCLEVDPQDPFATVWLTFLTLLTGRDDDCLAANERLRKLSEDPFYVTAAHGTRACVFLKRGDVAAAERVLEEARADHANPDNMKTVEALIAARAGRREAALAMVHELGHAKGLNAVSLIMAAEAATRVGVLEHALGFLARPLVSDMAPSTVRLHVALHPVLDREPFAPRRWETMLVWPLEAPMIAASIFPLFQQVRIDTGRPAASETSRG